MSDKLENPYEKFGAHPCEVKLGHGWCWLITFLFLLVCTLAPFWRNTEQFVRGPNGWTPIVEIFRYSKVGDETLYEHLRGAESRIEDADFTGPPRETLQTIRTAVFREGNRKTAIGRDGWLYYRPAIDAVTGYGPIKPEPTTVAKDPTREPWRGPLEAILHFESQLENFGVELILVPIPVKPMIYPEHLTGRNPEGPITHPDAETFYDALREGGIDVLDLSQPLFELKETTKKSELFLKQDTHWTPEGMQQFAGLVAEHLREKNWFGALASAGGDSFQVGEIETAYAPGDLVENLELENSGLFGLEEARITPLENSDIFDQDSPVVLLGDSFTNIYHQKQMNWGEQAGFAEHLSRELGLPLDTIAQNGQASTGVRRTLAVRPFAEKSMREEKKAVVWAIAARDLFLSESSARGLVEWKDVAFNKGDPAAGVKWPVVIEGTVAHVSAFPDPNSVPYPDCLYAVDYADIKVIEGTYPVDGAQVFHWAFRDKELQESAHFQVGDRVRLELEPFSEQKELQSLQKPNSSDRFDLPQGWAAPGKAKLLDGNARTASRSEQQAARIASIATVVFSLLLGAAILFVFRKKSALRRSRAAA